MSHTMRSYTPMKWRAGGMDELNSADRTWISESPNSLFDDHDDMGSNQEKDAGVSDIPVKKHQKFDELLRRIEAERMKMTTTSESFSAQRLGTSAASRRTEERERGIPTSSTSSKDNDFAGRARELRTSHYGGPTKSLISKPPERDRSISRATARKSLDNTPVRSLTPARLGIERRRRARELRKSLDGIPGRSGSALRPRGREPINSLDDRPERSRSAVRSSSPPKSSRSRTAIIDKLPFDGAPRRSRSTLRRASPPRTSRSAIDCTPSLTPSRKQSESKSAGKGISHRTRGTPPRQNIPKSIMRSSLSPPPPPPPPLPPIRSSSPNPSQEDFKQKIEQFHGSLMLAHGTISNLENDAHILKETISSLEERNMSLEERNETLNELLATNRNDMMKIKGDHHSISAENSAIFESQTEEIERLNSECERYKNYATKIEKLASERYVGEGDILREKQELKNSVHEKDKIISELQDEIQRMGKELTQAAIMKSKAIKAEETVRKLGAKLEMSKNSKQQNHDGSNTRVVVDLNQANITITRSTSPKR